MKDMKDRRKKAIIYQAKNGAIELRGDVSRETVWATQAQIADIFDVQKAAISKHLKNIFESGELEKESTVSISETVQKEGRRTVSRGIEYYNLDAIISVGYRVNSQQATQFRIWATKTLRNYITDGYVINRKQIASNYAQFMEAVGHIRRLLPASATIDHDAVLELVSAFADTWVSLDAYDKDVLAVSGATKKSVSFTSAQLSQAVAIFKNELLEKGEATSIFGQERHRDSIAGIVGNVMQSFGGKPVYPTVEEKAAHLLYFMVKNHPFVDGNKRSGAYSFVWFLKKAGVLDASRMTPPALTALTLLVAESSPAHKEKMVKLIVHLLRK